MVMVLLWRFIRRNINYNDKENKTTGGRNGALGKISLSNVDTRGVDVLASSLSNTNTCRGNVVIRICILPLGSDWSIFLSDKVKNSHHDPESDTATPNLKHTKPQKDRRILHRVSHTTYQRESTNS
ncbi:hypothetical protein G4B88_022270 [Cannabis sativa]|uniref:Uncharacterized protein n=1 Tax=Cannabis sativa TaxID=3483 RepID=A0A7J6EEA5_CANSA|nr:hypothetical protein G4B88_022270 [Cannabis sativa]